VTGTQPTNTDPCRTGWAKSRASGVRRLVGSVALAGLLLGSCGAPPRFLEPLFPDASDSASKPFIGTVRRKPPKIEKEEIAEIKPLPERPDLAQILATLPREEDGTVKWMQALADKLIAPKPGVAEDAKDEEPTDMDVELTPKDQPEYKVVFSHKVHTSWLVCDNCHTSLFEMEHGKTVITMDKINQGTSCGTCHGKVAAPEAMACPACHQAMGK
jgi:c(7)-type cytochrome triheme protein